LGLVCDRESTIVEKASFHGMENPAARSMAIFPFSSGKYHDLSRELTAKKARVWIEGQREGRGRKGTVDGGDGRHSPLP